MNSDTLCETKFFMQLCSETVADAYCAPNPVPTPLVVKDRLLTVFNEEVGGDVAVIREYRGIACGLRISMRKREECIKELKALGDRQGVAETVRFMEGLQADEMDRCNRTLSLIREMEVKAREKSSSVKMAKLMKQIQDKDIRNLMKLQTLGKEFELRGQEKEIFIQKLKGNMDF
ncbi:hypothetical protein Tco_1179675 [Tanacetum coccineum]